MTTLLQRLKYPAIYATSFSLLTGVTEGINVAMERDPGSALESALKTSVTNFPFFGAVNLVYAQGVDFTARKYGRVGANLLCLGVNATFAAYAYLTGDRDPTYQALATTAVGLVLTNMQVSSIPR